MTGAVPAATDTSPTIRPATEADGPAIRALIREAQLNPRDLDWRRFLVADDGGTVVGCAQIRVHGAGSRELASVAVTASSRGRGTGRAISEAAIAREPVRPLYLYTESRTEAYWAKFAFRTITGDAIPRDMRTSVRIANAIVRAFGFVIRHPLRIVVMQRDDP